MQSRATMSRGLFVGLTMALATAAAHGAISCSVNTLPLNFGNYDPFTATPLDVATTATITCTSNRQSGEFALFTSSISRGRAPSFSPREMRNALNNPLNYNLFTTTARTTIFGDGSAGTSERVGFGWASRSNPAIIRHDIFGRIFAGQDVSVGSYSDTLIFTVTF